MVLIIRNATNGDYILIVHGTLNSFEVYPLSPMVRRKHQCIDIGQGFIIGAGSVVTKDISPFRFTVDNPVRVYGSIK
ncbi:hypothetical protein PIROE2DRAFT_9238 [Piromyces sp. E2]|nr:hypothetical protein PIROE2DRAFT_9238 [Piromyces sp. E2]|eukprot:OUM64073.1 hypothetical protein PIROE2DRAFT_9238 [Piromyces sp. E2]